MTKKSRPLNLEDFDAIDWDSEGDPTGNHAHCAEPGVDERVVDEVLNGDWVNIEILGGESTGPRGRGSFWVRQAWQAASHGTDGVCTLGRGAC